MHIRDDSTIEEEEESDGFEKFQGGAVAPEWNVASSAASTVSSPEDDDPELVQSLSERHAKLKEYDWVRPILLHPFFVYIKILHYKYCISTDYVKTDSVNHDLWMRMSVLRACEIMVGVYFTLVNFLICAVFGDISIIFTIFSHVLRAFSFILRL